MDTASVVRVFVTFQEPSQELPWQRGRTEESSGSGVIVGPGRILTGAHVVAHATFLQVRTLADPEKFTARIEGVCHDSDLALLRVDDPAFMEGVAVAELGELPEFQDQVAVIGFPVGGEEVSITAGVVSRIEVQEYVHSQRYLLAITVDAAINSGNSGGPVFDEEGRVVGIAFQGLDEADNIGHMVPVTLVDRFLQAVDNGRPLDVPGLGIRWQSLENPTLRSTVGLGDGETGVLITDVDQGSSADGVLRRGDALVEIAGERIANSGTIRYRQSFRTAFDVVLGDCFVGDALPIAGVRDGKRFETSLTLAPYRPLVPRNRYEESPRWFCVGGLVFQTLRREYLTIWEQWWDRAPKQLLALYEAGVRTAERQEVIMLTSVLADELNVGYAFLVYDTVQTVDGEKPADFGAFVAQVDRALDKPGGRLDIRMATGRIVLDVDKVRQNREAVFARYGLPSDRASDA
jgi:S1-C subfamily serine protease